MKLRQRLDRAVTQTEFDPTTVPVFPVLTVEVVDDQQLLVDGQVKEIPADTRPTDAAVEAAAAAVRRRGLDHCRVAAVVDGTSYPLVVGADGSRHDLSGPTARRWTRPATDRQDAPARGWVIPLAVMILALVTAAVAVVTVNQFRSRSQVTAPAAPPTPSPTELPVLPPDGWTTHADWSAPLASLDRTGILAAKDVVLAVTADDKLTALDAATGATRAQTAVDGSPTAGPVITTVEGQAVVALVTSRNLYWWPDPENLGDTRRVALTPQAKVTFTGGSPLITLPGQHAAVIVDGVLSDRIIPAGAQAVRGDTGTVTAVDAGGRLWRLDSPGAPVPPPIARLQPPRSGQTPTLLGSTNSHLITGWRHPNGSAGTLTITNLRGETVASRDVGTLRTGDEWIAGPNTAVTAGHIFSFRSPRIMPISDPAWRTSRIVADTVYGSVRGDSAELDASSGKVRRSASASAVPPVAVDSRHGYVTATTPSGPVLYALQPR